MDERNYAFIIRGANDYMLGRISGLMHALCRDDPAENRGYGLQAIKSYESGEVLSWIMRVDTTADRFKKFMDCVTRTYSDVDGFKIEPIGDQD